MEQYNVTGMSCAACVARVEKAVNSVDGVTSCAVSLLTNSMGVEGTADSATIIKAVVDAGYGASLKKSDSSANKAVNYDNELQDTETPKIKKRLIVSLILLIPLMYVSMGHMMWKWPLPAFLDGNHIAMGIYELLLSALIMVINQKFFINGFKGALHRSPNMDTLVAMGSMASFCYSVYALFAMTSLAAAGDHAGAAAYMNEFYFESAAMILTLITVGKMLEARSKGKTTDAIKSLMKLSPKTAVLLIDGKEVETPIEQVHVGAHFVVKPGENIPVDGIVVEGSSAVNEAALTGESIPVDKAAGDQVSAATVNQSGYLICEATRVGEDTTLSQIIQMVSDAAATKAPIAKIADRVSGVFVPAVLGISLFTFVIWMLTGKAVGFSLARAISVLVISCPCALGLATPVAIMVGNGMGAKNGIMFKTAVSLEETGKMAIVALDKTGTITKGEPKVTVIYPASGVTEAELLLKANALEEKSEHPLAKAIVEKVRDISETKADDIEKSRHNTIDLGQDSLEAFEIVAGNGLQGILKGKMLWGGNYQFVSDKITSMISAEGNNRKKECQRQLTNLRKKAEELSADGQTPMYFAEEDRVLGIISVADTIKKDSAKAIQELKDMGIHVVMLTGDNEKTANAIGAVAGVDEVVADVRPEGKEEIIRELQKFGKVAMVGDGINDAPALTRADMGIAIGAGTDIAIDAADVVLMKSSLTDVPAAIRLSQATLKNIHENLFWAFFYNIIGIPLAAGLWIPIFGLTLNPMFGAAAMSLSSFCVITNALRLNLIKIYDTTKQKTIRNSVGHAPILNKKEPGVQETPGIEEMKNFQMNLEMEDLEMEITVTGMMCPHCEAHMKAELEKIDGVVEATANHSENLVVIKTEKEISEDQIIAAVKEAGYEYGGIR